MENKKAKKVALNDELLDKVSGGVYGGDPDDNTTCQWNLSGVGHEWTRGDDGKLICIYCGVYIN